MSLTVPLSCHFVSKHSFRPRPRPYTHPQRQRHTTRTSRVSNMGKLGWTNLAMRLVGSRLARLLLLPATAPDEDLLPPGDTSTGSSSNSNNNSNSKTKQGK